MKFMKKGTLTILLTLCTALTTKAQLTLDECKRLARENYPTVKQYRLIEQSRDFTVSNAMKAWLPQVSASATAAWFTDPVETSSPMFDIDNSLYSVSLQVKQNIYDGGETAMRKKTIEAEADMNREHTNVIMYELNSRIEQLFFGVLTIDERIKQCKLLQDDLGIGLRTVSSMERSGMANNSDIEAVKVELLSVRQQEEALKASRKAYTTMLSTFTGKFISEDVSFTKPTVPTETANSIMRPELDYYSAKNHLLDIRLHSLDTKLRPRLSAFATGMYHNKLLGMMNNGLLAAGLTLSWNIGALYTRGNDKKDIETERQMNAMERETFLFNTSLQGEQADGAIDNLRRQITLDNEIINLRESIRKKSEKKVKGGTETVNEMLRDINAVSEARQTKALHEIQLIQEMYNKNNIYGK